MHISENLSSIVKKCSFKKSFRTVEISLFLSKWVVVKYIFYLFIYFIFTKWLNSKRKFKNLASETSLLLAIFLLQALATLRYGFSRQNWCRICQQTFGRHRAVRDNSVAQEQRTEERVCFGCCCVQRVEGS